MSFDPEAFEVHDPDEPGVVELNVALPAAAVRVIENWAFYREQTPNAILREAISLYNEVHSHLEQGHKILINDNGVIREVVFTDSKGNPIEFPNLSEQIADFLDKPAENGQL